MDGLLPSGGRVAPVLLDLMGYDASPAKYVMNKLATGVIKVGKLKRFKKVSSDLKTILKTDLANLRFLSFQKGEACQSILLILRGKLGLSKPEVKKIGCV